MKTFRTFADLEFKPHPMYDDVPLALDSALRGAKQATFEFDNGYGISVVTGHVGFHVSEDGPYEVGILLHGELYGGTPVADGEVVGYRTADDVTAIMLAMQELPAPTLNPRRFKKVY